MNDLAVAHVAAVPRSPSVALDVVDVFVKNLRYCETTDVPIDIAYATHGDVTRPPMVLCAGLGEQLLDWHDGLVERLARKFFVIRWDYRDTGRSTKMAHRSPGLCGGVFALCHQRELPYSMADIADDMWALVDRAVSGTTPVHLVGFGAGAYVAQLAALAAPGRVLSLSMLAPLGGFPPAPAALQREVNRAGRSDDEDAIVDIYTRVLAKDTAVDVADVRASVRRSLERTTYRDGYSRMREAITAAVPLHESWRTLATEDGALVPPTVIVRGAKDPLSLARDCDTLVDVIPGASLVAVGGMGHRVDTASVETVASAIYGVARSKAAARRTQQPIRSM